MSGEQLNSFLAKVQADASLREQLKAAVDGDAVTAIAKSAGFSITMEDLNSHSRELSAEELEGVAGGGKPKCFKNCKRDTHEFNAYTN